MDCSSVHGILHTKILEWAAMPFSRGSSWPRMEPTPLLMAGGFFTTSTSWEAQTLVCMHACSVAIVMSDSLWPNSPKPSRLLCPWDSPGENTGVGCPALLQGIFPTQGLNLYLLQCRWILYYWATGEALTLVYFPLNILECESLTRVQHFFSFLYNMYINTKTKFTVSFLSESSFFKLKYRWFTMLC